MVVNRGHTEDAFASEFERRHLHHHRQGLNHEHAAHDEENDFLAHDHRDYAQRGAQCQRADVAHEDLCGISVEPQKRQTRTRHRRAKYRKFARTGNMRQAKIFGEHRIAGDIRKNGERTGDHHRRQYRQAVQAVGKVDRITRPDNYEVGQRHKPRDR